MDRVLFVAALFIGAGCGLLLGGMSLYERFQFWNDGQSGLMESSDPLLLKAYKYQQFDSLMAEVTYVTPSQRVTVPGKYLSGDFVKRLGAGEKIPVLFLSSNPQRAEFDHAELTSPWPGLSLGAALTVAAVFALRLLRREGLG